MSLLPLLVGFLFGALTIVAIEVLGVLFFIFRLNRRDKQRQKKVESSGEFCGDNLDLSHPYKQGSVWVLETEKVPKTWLTDKQPREQKRKKEIVEVTPVRKHAKLKDQLLILTESDGPHTEIWLKGCTITAVSATNLPSRKWAKRYPIKVENKTSVIYRGSRNIHIYLGTSWEKESWCKALRLASCNDKEKIKWFHKLRIEFNSYLTSFNTGYPSFMKPSIGFNGEVIDKSIKLDGSSKVLHFLKKIAKKASKSGVENKAIGTTASGREERKIREVSGFFQESISATGSGNPPPTGKIPIFSAEENMVPSPLSNFTRSGSSGADSNDKVFNDEGTLCWNLLISRLFFDVKSNAEIRSFMLARVQRALSNMRIPSFIGEVTCTGIHPGSLPPYIHGMRVLPSDVNEVVTLEIDFENSGGAVLDIETRLEVRELDLQEGMDSNSESGSVGEAKSDLLEGLEYFEKQLELSEESVDEVERRDEGDPKLGDMKRSKSSVWGSSSLSKWKCILNSIAKKVSEVPLSLTIRVASLRGTLQLHIKSPPSDQLWFGFTSMPDIEFNLESTVGEHKIANEHIALFLTNRFKAAIRETMVLPNCECVGIPWMLAEKDDWVPRGVAPFIWVNQAVNDPATVHKVPASQPSEAIRVHEASNNHPKDNHNKAKKSESIQQRTVESSDAVAPSSGPTDQPNLSENPVEELRAPLLGNEPEENSDCQSPSRSLILAEEHNRGTDGDYARQRRMGTRARMVGLGKKMGEKLEEKRRHIEERGRNIVERMRAPENK